MPKVDDVQTRTLQGASSLDERPAHLISASTDEPPSEQAVTLHLVSAEIGHELAHTSNFLRFLMDALEDGLDDRLTCDEVRGYAQQEFDRIQKLLRHLRGFRMANPDLVPTELGFILESVIARLKADHATTTLEVQSEAPADTQLLTDSGFLCTALHHLLSHAVANCAADGRVVVRVNLRNDSADTRLQIDMMDDGGPLGAVTSAALFNAWSVTSEDQPTRLRVLAFRMLRSLDGTLTYRRTESCNVFQITLPTASGVKS